MASAISVLSQMRIFLLAKNKVDILKKCENEVN